VHLGAAQPRGKTPDTIRRNLLDSVAVTGASGFIGKHAASAFRDAGAMVRGFTRASAGANLIPLNYFDSDLTARAFDGADTIVHAAGLAHVSAKSLADPTAEYFDSNVRVAVNMVTAGIRAGVANFILLSSAGVLGQESPAGGFHDASPPMPYDAYTRSKYDAEQRVLDIADGKIAVIIVRPPMVYGPGAPGSFRRLCQWIDRGLPLPLGKVSARRSFVGIRNLCHLLVAIASSTKQVSPEASAMLVADLEPMTVMEFATKIAAVHNKRARPLPVPSRLLEWGLSVMRLQEEYRRLALPFELAPSRAREIYEWQPPYSTGEELAWTLEG
jgi:nucleoside-diphosphate-sugar epimerase